MQYKCKKCNLSVIVINDKIIKACKCDAPIVANIEASAKGIGGLEAK